MLFERKISIPYGIAHAEKERDRIDAELRELRESKSKFVMNACVRRPARCHPTGYLAIIIFLLMATLPTKAQHTQPGRYASVNGLKMYYEIHGISTPLVLIHGGGSTIKSTFGRILPDLAKTHQVIAVELQAHGHTRDIDRPLSFEQDADDVAALLKQLHIENAISWASATYRRDGMQPGFFEGFENASLKDMPKALQDASGSQPGSDPNGLQTMFDRDVARMAAFKDISDADIRVIKAPVLVINGYTDVVRPEHALALSRTLSHAQLAVLPGAHGDYIGAIGAANKNSKIPPLVVALIGEFLDAQPTK